MTIGIMGTKIGMTQIFDGNGLAIPVTIIKAGPCFVTQKKIIDKHGYDAIQVGYKIVKPNKLNKPLNGHLTKAGLNPLKYLREYRVNHSDISLNVGDSISIDQLKIGDYVNITGNSIGKGFASTRKRHNFNYGPMTHGSKNHRAPGSIGAGTTPGRVIPNKRMAGRLGNQRTTIKNLEVININTDDNLLIIKGAVPGKRGNLLSIQAGKNE
uniref:Large ribosomal subunit protein uL3c n=1 Tax=Porphyridium purpureum TaxID=35688 RepID=W0RYG8_PORPP|nr:chloroplast 50S ribosomal protein L3 [Porphyridium purpureum]BAO23679.1 chloroplast 50S ribosomal protein L3 [Porphyridium purpureum]